MPADSPTRPDARCERVRMALAEAGFPVREGAVFINADGEVELMFGGPFHGVTKQAWWRAKAVAGVQRRCWSCFDAAPTIGAMATAPECDHDPMTSPWPDLAEAPR